MGAVGERVELDVQDDRSRQIEALTGQSRRPPASGIIRAPMPGLVVRVEVTIGQAVEAGTALVVVEARKMENELRAPHRALVQQIHASAGDPVVTATPLVTRTSKPSAPYSLDI